LMYIVSTESFIQVEKLGVQLLETLPPFHFPFPLPLSPGSGRPSS